jgi:hypothetical protein
LLASHGREQQGRGAVATEGGIAAAAREEGDEAATEGGVKVAAESGAEAVAESGVEVADNGDAGDAALLAS